MKLSQFWIIISGIVMVDGHVTHDNFMGWLSMAMVIGAILLSLKGK